MAQRSGRAAAGAAADRPKAGFVDPLPVDELRALDTRS
jgi:hypothetical protein